MTQDPKFYEGLFWDGNRGWATRNGRQVRITGGPDLGEGPVHELDYRPGIGLARMRATPITPRTDLDARQIARAAEIWVALLPDASEKSPYLA